MTLDEYFAAMANKKEEAEHENPFDRKYSFEYGINYSFYNGLDGPKVDPTTCTTDEWMKAFWKANPMLKDVWASFEEFANSWMKFYKATVSAHSIEDRMAEATIMISHAWLKISLQNCGETYWQHLLVGCGAAKIFYELIHGQPLWDQIDWSSLKITVDLPHKAVEIETNVDSYVIQYERELLSTNSWISLYRGRLSKAEAYDIETVDLPDPKLLKYRDWYFSMAGRDVTLSKAHRIIDKTVDHLLFFTTIKKYDDNQYGEC